MAEHGERVRHALPRERATESAAGRVVALGITHLQDTPADFPEAEAEVDILRAIEVAGIEAPDLGEGISPNELAGTNGKVHVP
jgi:hypothetical protein